MALKEEAQKAIAKAINEEVDEDDLDDEDEDEDEDGDGPTDEDIELALTNIINEHLSEELDYLGYPNRGVDAKEFSSVGMLTNNMGIQIHIDDKKVQLVMAGTYRSRN